MPHALSKDEIFLQRIMDPTVSTEELYQCAQGLQGTQTFTDDTTCLTPTNESDEEFLPSEDGLFHYQVVIIILFEQNRRCF